MKNLLPQKIRNLAKMIGPGVITGASDDDPSGIATYSQTGAQFGYQQLWMSFFICPFMIVIQEMSGRIGLITGTGLAGAIKNYYSKKILYGAVILLLVANTINLGADLGVMAASAQMLFGLPFFFWLLIFTAITLLLEVFISYEKYSKVLKWLCISLIAYVLTAIIAKQNWLQIAQSTFIPSLSFDKDTIMNIVAVLGTTISPYLFFWQANEEVEEEIEHHQIVDDGVGRAVIHPKQIKNMRIDTIMGMLLSQIIMFFIIITTASTLFAHGIHNIDSPQAAASALKPFAGDFAYIVFAIGIIGTGLLAIPIFGASSSYAISETFEFKSGLSKKFRDAPAFYAIIAFSTFVGLAINLIGINPIQALYFTAIINGILAPPIMVILIFVANNKKIMKSHVNGKVSNILAIIVTAAMSIAVLVLLLSFFL